MPKLYTGGKMPLVSQQAVIHGFGASFQLALEALEAQMDEMPDLRIISISASTPSFQTMHLVAVVETI